LELLSRLRLATENRETGSAIERQAGAKRRPVRLVLGFLGLTLDERESRERVVVAAEPELFLGFLKELGKVRGGEGGSGEAEEQDEGKRGSTHGNLQGLFDSTSGGRTSCKKRGGRSRPSENPSDRASERDLQRGPQEARSGAPRDLAVVLVVGARAGGACRAERPIRSGLPRLDAGLTVEGAALARHEASVGIEPLIDRRNDLPVQQVEDVELRRDGDRSDPGVVSQRDVGLVLGRKPAVGAA